ncbi:MAG: Ig-like domain-containing protein [Prevotellaceae bacterium]|jgi:hypothetical protein|nr:Ig-like domain-containing protein [Prevotellaceae bacterium]
MKIIQRILIFLIVSLLSYSCANRGIGPQGGKKDEMPPRMLRSIPQNGVTDFQGNHVEMEFDELFSVRQASENVIFSPPQINQPTVTVAGRMLRVTFNDEMLPNTTYTIDFGNAIEDNNEHNQLQNFIFSFSTGVSIDSLQIAGTVLNAADLNPAANVLVGIHSNPADSAFIKTPFLRVSKTDETGNFRLTNMPEGKYRVFGLRDKNRSFTFDNPGEDIAWNDSLVTPSFTIVEKFDTLWKDSLTIDTISHRKVTEFKPSNIILRLFNENFQRRFLAKSERTDKTVRLFFNAPQKELPEISALNFDLNSTILQASAKNDTLTFWLKDSLTMKKDTLTWQITYPRTLASGKDSIITDTLKLAMKSRKVDAKEEIPPLRFKSNMAANFPANTNVILTFEEPVLSLDSSAVCLFQKKDTLWIETPAALKKTGELLRYQLNATLEPGESYKLQLDSAAVKSIFGNATAKYENVFKVRGLEEYAVLIVTLPPVENAVLQLLNASEAVLKEQKAGEEETVIEFIEPGTYYLRLFIDENRNGIWDTGNFERQQQPETVYYFHDAILLRANWDVEVEWTEFKPLTEQKPETIRKVIK